MASVFTISGGTALMIAALATRLSPWRETPARVYKAGEAWAEQPGDHHKVSANASTTKPARLLAIFVVDTSEKEILFPDK